MPALVIIPIEVVIWIIVIILIVSTANLIVAAAGIATAVILAAVAIPEWIVIYSFRQELQERTETGVEMKA